MQSLRILVVDDDVDLAEALADVLESQGHRVDLCHTGEDAVARFTEHSYDITFMDVRLPVKNGVESFLEIMALKPDARVIMMTGYSMDQLLQRAVDGGAWAVMQKPFEIPKVLSLMENLSPAEVILIADDDVDFSRTLKEQLESHGFSVRLAEDGARALERIEEDGIRLLILDLRMPVMDGLSVCMELKRRQISLPTIFVTGYEADEADTIDSLRNLPMTSILMKPFDPAEMLRAVSVLFDADHSPRIRPGKPT